MAAGWLALRADGSETRPLASVPAQAEAASNLGPGPAPVDPFHPARAKPAQPAYGGSLRVHIESLSSSLNLALTNNSNARAIQFELNETLVRRDWESWKIVPDLAASWEVADTLVERGGKVHYGRIEAGPEPWKLLPLDEQEAGELTFARDAVEHVERGTVITLHLREGVRWQDGHPFDAEDVLFSWRIAENPAVRCDWVRPYLKRIVRAEAEDAHTVRFFLGEQYFNVLGLFADNFFLLPRHLYDLRDPDHPRHKADATDAECAKEINENPHNTEWIGLGPYRLTSYSQQGIEAARFADYFDPENSGYVDRIVWRHIPDDAAAYQALLEGQLDFSTRLSSEQYFGEATQKPAFVERYCKGYFYLGSFNYVAWNMRRPKLADVRVRKALAHAMDLDGYVRKVANGLALAVTGPQCYFGPAYDHDVLPLAYDLDAAAELLREAGWYDRDGDGRVDKDGQALEVEILTQSGNASATLFGQIYQESLAKIGVRLTLTALDWATYRARMDARDFDGGMAGWAVDVTENDPIQLWHSSAAGPGGSNHAGVIDAHVDDLIARGDRELDDATRWGLWRELHRYLYQELQPYLFREMPPRKFALNQALRGVQFFKINPGYAPRRWYFPAGTPGTRPTLAR